MRVGDDVLTALDMREVAMSGDSAAISASVRCRRAQHAMQQFGNSFEIAHRDGRIRPYRRSTTSSITLQAAAWEVTVADGMSWLLTSLSWRPWR